MIRVAKLADFDHKLGKGFGKWATHTYPTFLGVTPPGLNHGDFINTNAFCGSFSGSVLTKNPLCKSM